MEGSNQLPKEDDKVQWEFIALSLRNKGFVKVMHAIIQKEDEYKDEGIDNMVTDGTPEENNHKNPSPMVESKARGTQ